MTGAQASCPLRQGLASTHRSDLQYGREDTKALFICWGRGEEGEEESGIYKVLNSLHLRITPF